MTSQLPFFSPYKVPTFLAICLNRNYYCYAQRITGFGILYKIIPDIKVIRKFLNWHSII